MKKIAVYDPWPNEASAEKEFLARLKHCVESKGGELLILSPESGNVPTGLEFVLHLDPTNSSPIKDVKNYLLLWIPPSFVTHFDYAQFHFNMGLFDKIFSVWPNKLSAHADIFLFPFEKNVERCLVVPSTPQDYMLAPFDFSTSPFIFYAGVNSEMIKWEHGRKVLANHGRFFDLFKELDSSTPIKFFGPSTFGGLPTWDGFSQYSGFIPFDGKSIIYEINKCGVVLVIHSESHKTYDMPTNRLFEACAGGAIAIADKLDFIVNNFGDSVLYIDQSLSIPLGQQIKDHLKWIQDNPEKARQKVIKAQQIFLSKFTLDIALKTILAAHEKPIATDKTFNIERPISNLCVVVFEKNGQPFSLSPNFHQSIDYKVFTDDPLNVTSKIPSVSYHPKSHFFDTDFLKNLAAKYSHFTVIDSAQNLLGSSLDIITKLDRRPGTALFIPYLSEKNKILGSKTNFSPKDIAPALPSTDLRLFLSDTYPWYHLEQSPIVKYPTSSFIFPTTVLRNERIELLKSFNIEESITLFFLIECLACQISIENSFTMPLWSAQQRVNLRNLADHCRIIYDLFIYDRRLTPEFLNELRAQPVAPPAYDPHDDPVVFFRLARAFLLNLKIAKYLKPLNWLYKKIK